jgi:hypothetical protein
MASLLIKVNGTKVFPGASKLGMVSLVSLTINYDDPAELKIEIADRDIWSPAFPADSDVQLYVDEVLRFRGLSGVPRARAAAGSGSPRMVQEITCRDYRHALRHAPHADKWDNTAIPLDGGKLSEVLAEYLEYVRDELERVGMATTFKYSGGAEDAVVIPVTCQSGGVDGGFAEIAGGAKGVRCLIDPGDGTDDDPPAYRFIKVFGVAAYDLAFERLYIPQIDIEVSLDDRYGAVRVGESRQWGQTERYDEETLVPAWEEEYEENWTPETAYQSPSDEVLETFPGGWADNGGPSWVYRRFSFAAFADELPRDAAMIAAVYSDIEGDDPVVWLVEIDSVDWEAQTVLLKYPALRDAKSGQPFGRDYLSTGWDRSASQVKLRYAAKESVPMVSQSVRVPPQGFGGRAYQLAPKTCGVEHRLTVPAGVDKETYVREAFAALSEPLVRGSVPISGELPEELWLLGRRINIVRESGDPTGLETLAAPLLGVAVEFAGGGKATLEFNSDRSAMVQGGLT